MTTIDADKVYLTVRRGDTIRFQFTMKQANGQPLDVTGWSFLSQLRDTTDTLVESFTINVLDAANGVLELLLPAINSASLPVDSLNWDLQATDPVSDVRTLFTGRVKVLADVSRI